MFRLVVGLAATVICLSSIHVRPERKVQEVNIKVGEQTELDFPDFPFEDIYEREIWQTDDVEHETSLDGICRQRPSQVELNRLSFIGFRLEVRRKAVIYDFEDIKKKKDVVDMHYLNQTAIFVAFENATLAVFGLENQTLVTIRALTFPDTTEIEYGEFHTMMKGERLLFITEKSAYLIEPSAITQMDGYHPSSPSFSGAIAVGDKYLAVAYESLGIVFYELVSDFYLKQSGGYAASFFNRSSISVQDVAYHQNSSTLFILDLNYGVYATQVHVNPEGHMRMTLLPKGSHRKGCYMMMLVQGDLYLVCQEVFKIGIMTDSITQRLDNPWFKVKKMSKFGNLLVLMGQNFFKVYHNDRFVEDFQYDRMDRFHILSKDTYISANEDGLAYGKYKLDPPVILCHTSNERHQGMISAVVRTEAECNNDYFEKYRLELEFNSSDTCVYTTPVNLVFWNPTDLNLAPFKIAGAVLLVVVIAFMIWACCVRRQAIFLQEQLKGYKSVGGAKKKQQYDPMVEEPKEIELDPVDNPVSAPSKAQPAAIQ